MVQKNCTKEVNTEICSSDDTKQFISSLFPSRELSKFSVK